MIDSLFRHSKIHYLDTDKTMEKIVMCAYITRWTLFLCWIATVRIDRYEWSLTVYS